jgi:hypothetical protein
VLKKINKIILPKIFLCSFCDLLTIKLNKKEKKYEKNKIREYKNPILILNTSNS